MSTSHTQKARLKFNRPSLRARARPPKQRTSLGQAFTSANLNCTLALQHCCHCQGVQYPPRELCHNCLSDDLQWQETQNTGRILSQTELHHSQWEFFKRKLLEKPWAIASIKLDCGVTVFSHLAIANPTAGSAIKVFTHRDASLNSVIIAVAVDVEIETIKQRLAIAQSLGLTEPAVKQGGI